MSLDFSNRTNNLKLDSLNKYILDNRIISWKKAPISNSTFRNIFKKKQTIGLSSILFDRQNNLALVKIQSNKNCLSFEICFNFIHDCWDFCNEIKSYYSDFILTTFLTTSTVFLGYMETLCKHG